LSEGLGGAMEFFKKHKVAVGLGAALLVLYFLLRGGSSSATSGGADNSMEIAQLEAAQNQQNAQLQAQSNAATLSAQVQQNQNNEALEGEQDQLAAELAGTDYQTSAAVQENSAQAAIYEDLINTGAQEQSEQDQLESQSLTQTGNLESTIVSTTNKAGHSGLQETGANELALLQGQGNIGSYNQANASETIAGDLETSSILSSVLGGASKIGAALF
jgi:hypothetical protein